MSIFKRLFKVGESSAHSIIDKLEDPVKMTEQGIRDLKRDLQEAMKSLAEVKAIAIRTRKGADDAKNRALDYEKKAMLLIQKAESGSLDGAEAERLATEALNRRDDAKAESARLSKEAQGHEKMASQLQEQVSSLQGNIRKYENDLATLKARARTAAATKKINSQLAKVDSSGTISMLERMRDRVEADEALAEAYGDVVGMETSMDAEIEAALDEAGSRSDSLADLKKRMGLS